MLFALEVILPSKCFSTMSPWQPMSPFMTFTAVLLQSCYRRLMHSQGESGRVDQILKVQSSMNKTTSMYCISSPLFPNRQRSLFKRKQRVKAVILLTQWQRLICCSQTDGEDIGEKINSSQQSRTNKHVVSE